MKFVRAIICILFVITIGVWGYYHVTDILIKDHTPPEIISDCDTIKLSIKDDRKELLRGLTATDDRDGDLTSEILIGTHSKFISEGIFKITYLVFDSSNNVSEYTRRVEYTDYKKPVFSLTQPLMFKTGETISMFPFIKVTDCLDGDITSKAKIVVNDVDSTKVGTYYVTFQVANSYADVITQQIPVNIVNDSKDSPKINLKSALVYLNVGDKFNPKSYLKSVTDKFDPKVDLNKVSISSTVDTKSAGLHQVEYTYKNSKGLIGHTFLTVIVREGK